MLKSTKNRLEEGEPPEKKLISEGDIFIKELAKKQLRFKTSLKEELAKQKEFISGCEYIPLQYSGKCSLGTFKNSVEKSELIGKLKSAGLTDTDIDIYFSSKMGADIQNTHKNISSSIVNDRLEKIDQLIRNHELQLQKNSEEDNHNLVASEPGLVVKPQSLETKLLEFAIRNKKSECNKSISYPMEEVKKLEEKISNDVKSVTPSINQIRRKARKLENRIKHAVNKIETEFVTKSTCDLNKSTPLVTNSKWDVKDTFPEEKVIKTMKTYTCRKQNYYTIKDGKIEAINNKPKESVQCAQRLSIEEIRKIPKFENYELGTPSKKLYLKNLHHSVTENDLREIFKECERSIDIIYNVMKGGRMRGQAFLEFPDTNLATDALNRINGKVLKDRPIIIEYAKLKS